ncbi:hypothetical protein B0H12DRAFT_1231209 [Mycena haematopus]|nr:hypothetical protein B0H12DRAFT_1231209 [Mycena haematopus]
MSEHKPRQPRLIHSPSWWADFHRRRRERAERAERAASSTGDPLPIGDQGLVYTFTRQWVAPLVSVVQNDGTLRTVAMGPLDPSPPAPRPNLPLKPSAVARRAQALLDARPSPDEVLLARLGASRNGDQQRCPVASPKGHSPPVASMKRKAASLDAMATPKLDRKRSKV